MSSSSSSLEFNKIAAAVLVALIIGMLTGILAETIIHPKHIDKDAFPIAAAGGEAKPAEAPVVEKPAPIPADMFAKADPVAGEATAKKCAACHSFDKGGANKVGPNLYGIIGSKRAHLDSFSYSDTIKNLGGTWDPQAIAAFIYNPKLYAPGTKMGFAGLPKPEDRANVISYLNKQSDTPVDLSKAQ